jgi:hypothetical protein
LAAVSYASAHEVFPPGPVYYGHSSHPSTGPLRGADALSPGPVLYGPMARAELFPFGPVGYGPYGAAADAFPPGPSYYGRNILRHEVFGPGPVSYGPPTWRTPYYGFPYPPCRAGKGTAAQFKWPSCVDLQGQGGVGGKTLPPRPAQPSQAPAQRPSAPPPQPPATAFQPPPVRAPEREPVVVPSRQSQTYRYEGEMIYGPEGSAYQRFGTRPPFGTQYERSGNMLYGVGSRCRLFGNSAFCW